MSNERSPGKNSAEDALVKAGVGIGGAVGGAAVGAAAANVAAAAAANAVPAALASVATGPFAAFAPAASTFIQPATWAVLATNPVGQAILVGGGAALGAFSLYKLAKKILQRFTIGLHTRIIP